MQYWQLVTKWWHETLTRLKARNWQAWAILVAGAFLVEEIARNVFVSGAQSALGFLWKQVSKAAVGPLGYGGLAVVLWVVALLTASYVAMWAKTLRKQIIGAEPLTLEERHNIQQIRTFWWQYGHHAPSVLYRMFSDLTEQLTKTEVLGTLLDTRDVQLKSEALTAALAPEGTTPLAAVQVRLQELYTSYQNAAKWVVTLRERLSVGATAYELDPLLLEAWTKHAKVFREKLNELCQHPENLQLRVFPGDLLDVVVRRFLEGEVLPTENPIVLRLRAATNDERRFLALFMTDQPPTRVNEPTTYLTYAVYQAGERLAADGVLYFENTEDASVRFSLAQTTVNVWQRGGASEPPAQTSIEFSLDTVWPSGASGTGARNSRAV